ncbi:MAG: PPC domain-containing DNA-binding protein [Candidatus Saccharimonadales bacterium]
MKTVARRLTDGQDLLGEIQKIVHDYDIKAGVLLSAVGSLWKSTIRLPVIDGNVKYIYPENVEIDSLHGTVSKSGCHLHISVSDSEGKVFGGHLKQGCTVRTTCELVIGILDGTTFTREQDPNTGFDELVIR